MGRYTARLPRTTRSKTNDPQCPYPTPRPFYESAVADKVLRKDNRAKIMALAIHPYISGQPHRIKYLEAIYDYVDRFEGVLHWNGAEILDWYLSTYDPAVIGGR